MKYLLHIDTSGDTAIVAIGESGNVVCSVANQEHRNHAATVNLMIQDMLAAAGIMFKDLSAVVVNAGPGSYTGLRIGMSTAKGLCYGLDIPLIADNKLTLMAFAAYFIQRDNYDYYIPVLLAREKEYFISVFDKQFTNTVSASHIIENQLNTILPESGKIYIISKGLPLEVAKRYSENNYVVTDVEVELKSWVFYAFEEYILNKTVKLSTSEPIYLKQVYTHK